jgi:hypothetical protein
VNSITTVSSSAGQFSFELKEPAEVGLVWISKAGFQALSISAPLGGWGETHTFELQEAESYSVVVVDAGGVPIEHAIIEQRGLPTTSFPHEYPEFEDAKQVLLRTAETDADGHATLASFPEYASIVARKNGQTSTRKTIGPGVPAASLIVGETFLLDGIVRNLTPSTSAYCGVLFEGEDASEVLGLVSVLADGAIPPTRFPRRTNGTYRFQLEGSNIAPSIVEYAAEKVTDRLHIELEAEPGLVLPLLFVGPDGSPVQSVQVRSYWLNEAGSQYARGTRRSDDDGLLDLHCTTSPVSISFEHPNFAPGALDNIMVSEEVTEPKVIQLKSFGKITGIVLDAGKPVANYRLHYWLSGSPSSLDILEVASSKDGRFQLERAPIGTLELFALAPELPQSAIEVVHVKEGVAAEIELHIPEQGLGIGQVVDAATGVPLPGCNVDRYLHNTRGAGLTLAHEQHPTGADGRFLFPGFGSKLEQIWITEPEHAGAVAQVGRGADERYDFGVIRLDRTSTLTIEFTGLDDYAGYSYSAQGANNAGPYPIPTSGIVELPGTLPNSGEIDVTAPDGRQLVAEFVLTTRGPWSLRIPLAGDGALAVTIEGAESSQLEGGWLRIQPNSSNQFIFRDTIYIISLSQEFNCASLPLDSLTLTLFSPDGDSIAAAQVTSSREGSPVTLSLGAEPRAIRIVDALGSPLEDVSFAVFLPGSNRAANYSHSNEDGVGLVKGLPQDQVQLILTGTDGTHSTALSVALGTIDHPTKVVFDPSASLEFLAMDRGTPLDGVLLSIRDATTGDFLGWPTTNAEGKATFKNVTEGEVLIHPDSTSIWSQTIMVSTSTSPTLETLEFRRIGALRVSVLDAYGEPAGGREVVITSDEFGASVAQWLANARVSSPTGLVTDASGQVVVEGLPNGSYSIVVEGEVATAHAPPQGEGLLEVQLKP